MANPDEKIQKRIALLRSVGDEHHGTLDAGVVLERIEMLLEDVRRLRDVLLLEPPRPGRFKMGPIIVSYFAVGLVTCLEWHARSRMADLFAFKPEAIETADLSHDVPQGVVAHLIRENSSITQYAAITRNYSTAEAYLSAMNRLFKELAFSPSAESILHSEAKVGALGGRAALDKLYDFRNMLVHEINRGHVGPAPVRNDWGCDEAEAAASLVREFVDAIETRIRDGAPQNFPHRLVDYGSSENLDEGLTRQIQALEEELAARIKGFESVSKASTEARKAEDDMLNNALPHLRWIDTKAAPRRALLRGRLAYLKTLKAEMGPEISKTKEEDS